MEAAAFFLGVMAFLAALLAVKVGCVGMAVWLQLVYPNAFGRIADVYMHRPGRCVAVGLLNLVILTVITLVLLNAGPLKVLGLVTFAVLISIAVLAYGPSYHLAARRLAQDADHEMGWRQLVKGGLAAEAAFAAPAIGQALSLAALVRGTGAVILGAMSRSAPADTPPAESA